MEYEASQNSKTKSALYKMKTKKPEFEALLVGIQNCPSPLAVCNACLPNFLNKINISAVTKEQTSFLASSFPLQKPRKNFRT